MNIEITDGYQIKINGLLAGSLEDALANFPTLDRGLWASINVELKTHKDLCLSYVDTIRILEARIVLLTDERDAALLRVSELSNIGV